MAGWKVERHSGRDNAPRRVIRYVSETFARRRFQKIKTDLRQGEVKLIDPDGNVVDSCWAPRLRTRW